MPPSPDTIHRKLRDRGLVDSAGSFTDTGRETRQRLLHLRPNPGISRAFRRLLYEQSFRRPATRRGHG
jgi:hypothetical protein